MKKPVLIVMAAGMGSRYGGLKQIDPVDESKYLIIDYSLFDAKRTGFETVIFIIRPDMAHAFRNSIGNRISRHMDVKYAYQLLSDVPNGFSVPDGRTKPWGTGHAVISARKLIDSPFVVINADDFYGRRAFERIYSFFSYSHGNNEHAMVGYKIENTLTKNGYVSRGVCEVDDRGFLTKIIERVHIKEVQGGAEYFEDGVKTFIPAGKLVSLNLWGFGLSMINELVSQFPAFLKRNNSLDSTKGEYFLPYVTNKVIMSGKASLKVLTTDEKWFGITYRGDKAVIQKALLQMRLDGKYPKMLWEDLLC